MSLKTILLLACTAFVSLIVPSCTNCSKKVNCPGFEDTLLTSWFPYKDKNQLIFISTSNDRDTFTLINTSTSVPYDINVGGLNPNNGCYSNKNYSSEEGDTSGKYMQVSLQVSASTYNDSSIKWAEAKIKRNQIYFNHLMDTGFSNITIEGQNTIINRLPSATIGNRTFNNVTSAYIDTTNGKINGIYKIYFGRNQGLVSYIEYPSLKTWVLQ